jgi:hypothetical protein
MIYETGSSMPVAVKWESDTLVFTAARADSTTYLLAPRALLFTNRVVALQKLKEIL